MTIRQQVEQFRSMSPTRLSIPVEPTHDPALLSAEWRGFKYGAGFVLLIVALVSWI